MTWQKDLDPCTYGRDAITRNVSIGWLSAEHEFEIGDVPPAFVTALEKLVTDPQNLYRGSHCCEFGCSAPPGFMPPHGNGEIHVPQGSCEGKIYIAPVLILHYVKKHNYRPPQEFIDAVLKVAT